MNVFLIMEVVIKSVLTLLVHTGVTVKVDIYCKATIKIVQVISKSIILNTLDIYLVSQTSKTFNFVCSMVRL